jgi:hypothetical protein
MNRKWLVVSVALVALSGCFLPQVYVTTDHRLISLKPEDLTSNGLAFLTPSTVTGQEEEKQAVAYEFSLVLKKERPAIRCITLPETLNALNHAGLATEYKNMIADYRDTGIFSRDTLKKVGEATKVKYAVQIKLMNFQQGSEDRFGIFGLRIINTRYAHVRLFFQIWNTQDGLIAWEGSQEIHYAIDTLTEKSVTQKIILQKAAHNIISELPKHEDTRLAN